MPIAQLWANASDAQQAAFMLCLVFFLSFLLFMAFAFRQAATGFSVRLMSALLSVASLAVMVKLMEVL